MFVRNDQLLRTKNDSKQSTVKRISINIILIYSFYNYTITIIRVFNDF